VRLGSLLGLLAYSLIGVRKRVALENLRNALGDELCTRDLQRIARGLYQNLGRGFAEFARFPATTGEDVLASVSIQGLEHIDRALERGKGAIAIAGHFGNWELLGAAVAASGYPVNFLVGKQTNRRVDELMNAYRRKMGIGIIPLGGALKGVLKALKANEIVAILSDQDAGSSGVFMDFFGRRASTPPGAATLALKLDSVLLPCFIVRQQDYHRHLAIIEEALPIPATGNSEDKARLLTQTFTSRLELYTRKHPDQWFWVHRRWKTKEAGASH
jgi:KDO2-lipid IV(A) lauroyltransferase